MRTAWLVVATGMTVLGCRSVRPRPLPPELYGTYEYVANLPGQTIRGTLHVSADTMLAVPETGYCRPILGPDPQDAGYSCAISSPYNWVQLRFGRQNPVQRSRWTASTSVPKQRTVCAQYGVDTRGQRICVRETTETYEVSEVHSGPLEIRRATP